MFGHHRIIDVKRVVGARENINPGAMTLVYRDEELADEHTVSDYELRDGTTVQMVLRA